MLHFNISRLKKLDLWYAPMLFNKSQDAKFLLYFHYSAILGNNCK